MVATLQFFADSQKLVARGYKTTKESSKKLVAKIEKNEKLEILKQTNYIKKLVAGVIKPPKSHQTPKELSHCMR